MTKPLRSPAASTCCSGCRSRSPWYGSLSKATKLCAGQGTTSRFEREGAPGDIPVVGRFSLSNLRYQVLAQPGSTITVEWFYCYLGNPEKTALRLKEKRAREGRVADASPPPFRPDQLEEGMIYRLTLKVVPSKESSPHGAVGGPGDVVLTERQYDQAVTVASGDHVLLRLPMSLPMTWAPVKGKEALRQVKSRPLPPERQEAARQSPHGRRIFPEQSPLSGAGPTRVHGHG